MLWTHFHLLISEPSACRLNWENHFKGWITDKCPRSWLLTAHAIYSQCPWFEPFVARHTHFSLSPLVSYQPLCHKLTNKGKKAPKKSKPKKRKDNGRQYWQFHYLPLISAFTTGRYIDFTFLEVYCWFYTAYTTEWLYGVHCRTSTKQVQYVEEQSSARECVAFNIYMAYKCNHVECI